MAKFEFAFNRILLGCNPERFQAQAADAPEVELGLLPALPQVQIYDGPGEPELAQVVPQYTQVLESPLPAQVYLREPLGRVQQREAEQPPECVALQGRDVLQRAVQNEQVPQVRETLQAAQRPKVLTAANLDVLRMRRERRNNLHLLYKYQVHL